MYLCMASRISLQSTNIKSQRDVSDRIHAKIQNNLTVCTFRHVLLQILPTGQEISNV